MKVAQLSNHIIAIFNGQMPTPLAVCFIFSVAVNLFHPCNSSYPWFRLFTITSEGNF